MSSVQGDPAELEKVSSTLKRSSAALTAEAKSIRSAVAGMSSFKGPDADRFRGQMDQLARSLTQQAEATARSAQSLSKLAADLRALRLR